jgi:hypothetical protein
MSTLSINIGSGFLQNSFDLFGSMENYVVLKLIADGRTQEYRTKIVTGKKQSPIIWNETINISVPKGAWNTAVLEVAINDEDVTTDDVCAVGKINLEHCGFFQAQGVTIPYSIRLYNDKKTEVSGELSFTSTLR